MVRPPGLIAHCQRCFGQPVPEIGNQRHRHAKRKGFTTNRSKSGLALVEIFPHPFPHRSGKRKALGKQKKNLPVNRIHPTIAGFEWLKLSLEWRPFMHLL